MSLNVLPSGLDESELESRYFRTKIGMGIGNFFKKIGGTGAPTPAVDPSLAGGDPSMMVQRDFDELDERDLMEFDERDLTDSELELEARGFGKWAKKLRGKRPAPQQPAPMPATDVLAGEFKREFEIDELD